MSLKLKKILFILLVLAVPLLGYFVIVQPRPDKSTPPEVPAQSEDNPDSNEEVLSVEDNVDETSGSPEKEKSVPKKEAAVSNGKVDDPEVETVHMVEDNDHKNDQFDFTPYRESSEVSDQPYSVPVNAYNEKEVLGFLPYWELSNYDQLQYSRLSTVAYFGLTSGSNGQWVSDSGRSGYNSVQFRQMRDLAHASGVKVVVVVKNFDAASIKMIVGNTGGAGDTLIENIINAIDDKNVDGVNIDFEYVANDANPVTNTLRTNFANWHDKLADRVHEEFPGAIVGTDVFGSAPLAGTAYDLRALGATSIDYVMMMTYDYTTTRCYDGKLMAPVSPLYGNDGWNVSYHVDLAAKQIAPEKIIMGVPYYGIDLRVKTADRNIYNARADYPNCDGGTETYSSITNSASDEYHNDSTIRWNDTEKARWYTYQYDGFWRHGYYDDVDSLGAKYDFVRDRNLGGIGIWALNYDAGRSELWDLIRTKFQKVPFIVGFQTSTSLSRVESIFSAVNLEVVDDLGNNVYRVIPVSGLSSDAISKLRKYREVSAVDFENPRSIRSLEQLR